jgi:hypothetical protein
LNPLAGEWQAFKVTKWKLGFFLKWEQWFTAHQTFLSQTSGPFEDVAGEFENFQSEYNELRREFIQHFNGSTGAGESHSGGPLSTLAGLGSDLLLYALLAGGAYFLITAATARKTREATT